MEDIKCWHKTIDGETGICLHCGERAAIKFPFLPSPPPTEEHYEVENEEMKSTLRKLGKDLSASIPPGWGFTLFLFSYGSGGQLFYISSAQRADMIEVVRAWLDKQDEMMWRPKGQGQET